MEDEGEVMRKGEIREEEMDAGWEIGEWREQGEENDYATKGWRKMRQIKMANPQWKGPWEDERSERMEEEQVIGWIEDAERMVQPAHTRGRPGEQRVWHCLIHYGLIGWESCQTHVASLGNWHMTRDGTRTHGTSPATWPGWLTVHQYRERVYDWYQSQKQRWRQ